MWQKDLLGIKKKAKERYDKKRKKPKNYKKGDLVLVEKTELAPNNTSRKLLPKYSGPMVVSEVLPNDRYIVTDMEGTQRTRKRSTYKRTVAVDRMKPWVPSGGISDSTDSDSGEDDVALSSSSESDEDENVDLGAR
ncbi:hypothetical protein NQ318_002949 [Aromia moschata]|uniref:Uncharacterized protein n=1 Tax=Aromia moschata TaxID=1265417 RepID=A0AAV8X814_9CUCU|nr:hypothetical protein NQ318_002949 [Aromia moschata]